MRISAVHTCVDRKDAGALPDLRKVAIHAIGQLGTAENMPLLDSLPQADGKVSQAVVPARAALERKRPSAK